MPALCTAARRDGKMADIKNDADGHAQVRVINRTGPDSPKDNWFCFEYLELKDTAASLEAVLDSETGVYNISKMRVSEGDTENTSRRAVKHWICATIWGNHIAVTRNSHHSMARLGARLQEMLSLYPGISPRGATPRIGIGLSITDLSRLAKIKSVELSSIGSNVPVNDPRRYSTYTRDSNAAHELLCPEEMSRRGIRVDMSLRPSNHRSPEDNASLESLARILVMQEAEHNLDYTIKTTSGDIKKGQEERLHEEVDIHVDEDGIPITLMTFTKQMNWLEKLRDQGKIIT